MRKLLSVLIIASGLIGCKNEEVIYPYDQSPFLEFESLKFIDSEKTDTLSLSVIIWDKERDLGLSVSMDDISYPYQLFSVVVDSEEELVTISNDVSPPFYTVPAFYSNSQLFGDVEYKKLLSDSDNRPDYNCDSYEIARSIGPDTLFVVRNEGHFNLLINFLENDGSEFNFQEIFNTQDCDIGVFNARFPNVEVSPLKRTFEEKNYPFKIEYINKYARRITYNMTSRAFRLTFLNEPFQLKIKIKDRELNDSNIVSSDPSTLDELSID